MTLNSELWTLSSPLYSIEPSFLNLFMKKLTRGRVVPTISASVSWVIFVVMGSGLPSCRNSLAAEECGPSAFHSN